MAASKIRKLSVVIVSSLIWLLSISAFFPQSSREARAATAFDDSASVVAATSANPNSILIPVLNNDTGLTGLSVVSVTAPNAGTAVIEPAALIAGNGIRYTPPLNQTGTFTFTYTADDDLGESTATVTVTVTNQPPQAGDDTAVTDADTAVTVNVLANDSDADGHTLSVSAATGAQGGTLTIANSGDAVTYTPNPGFSGQDSFSYTVTDGIVSALATVSVQVLPPAVSAQDDAATTQVNQPVTIAVLDNDSGDGLLISATGTPASGSVINNGDGSLTYTPNTGFIGTDAFSYTVTDGEFTDTATVTVTVTAPAPPPAAVDDNALTAIDTPVTIDVLANDTGAAGIALTITATGPAASGSVTGNNDGTLTYTPNSGFTGTDVFSYTVSDGFSSDTANVQVTIQPVLPAIDAIDDSISTNANTPVVIAVLANDSGSGLTITAFSDPAHGSVGNNGDGSLSYTPDNNFTGDDTFTYTITDGSAIDMATVTVTVIAPALDAISDNATTNAGQGVVISVLANDIGDSLAIASVSTPENGRASISNNTIIYTPNAGFSGRDTFTYTLSNGISSDTAIVSVIINPRGITLNDDSVTTSADTPVTLNVLANDSGGSLTLLTVSDGANGTVSNNGGGSVTYTPDSGFSGTDSFSYSASNGSVSATAIVNVTVNPVIVPPEPVSDQISLNAVGYQDIEGNTLSVTVLRASSDPAPGAVTVDISTPGDTARAGSDYQSVQQTLSWASGDTSPKTLDIVLNTDNLFEGEETFRVLLSNPTGGATLDTAQATATISDATNTPTTLTKNQREVLEALDTVCFDTDSSSLAAQCENINSLDPSELPDALDQISPEQVVSLPPLSMETMHVQLSNIKQRLQALRDGKRGMSLDGLTMGIGGDTLPAGAFAEEAIRQMIGGGGASADVLGGIGGRLGVFVNGRFDFGDKDQTDLETGYDFDVKGITAGVDYRFTDQFVAGASLGYAKTDTDFHNNRGEADETMINAAVYGTYYTENNFYFDTILSYGRADFDIDRRIVFPGVNTTTRGDTDGNQWSFSIAAGRDFYRDAWVFTPYLQLNYIRADIDGYRESGGDGLALDIGDQDITSLTTVAGARVSKAISTSWGILSPTAYVEWEHEFKDDQRSVTARFVEDTRTSFEVTNNWPDRNFFNIGVGAAATFTQGRSAFISYEATVGKDNAQDQSVQLGVRFEF